MGQFFFFGLLIITLLAGAFVYFVPKQPPNPIGFMMNQSGYNLVETRNRKRIQQLSMTTRNGLIKMHKQMDVMSQAQNRFLDVIQDQQQVLENTSKDASDIMLEAQGISRKSNKDILRLKDLTSKMQDEQRLLVANGKDLVALNSQITQSRQWISDQIDLAKVNTETSLSTLQQRYLMLKNQAADFVDKVVQYNQAVSDQMDRIQDHLNDLADNGAHGTVQQQSAKEHIRRMLVKESEDRIKLADSEERNRDLLKDAQERSQDLIDEEHQKAQDQQEMMRQRIEDQRQRIQDQQNR